MMPPSSTKPRTYFIHLSSISAPASPPQAKPVACEAQVTFYGSRLPRPAQSRYKKSKHTEPSAVGSLSERLWETFDAGPRINLHRPAGGLQWLLGRVNGSMLISACGKNLRSASRLSNSLNPRRFRPRPIQWIGKTHAGNTEEIVDGPWTNARGFQLLPDAFPLTIWEYELFRARKRRVTPAIRRLCKRGQRGEDQVCTTMHFSP